MFNQEILFISENFIFDIFENWEKIIVVEDGERCLLQSIYSNGLTFDNLKTPQYFEKKKVREIKKKSIFLHINLVVHRSTSRRKYGNYWLCMQSIVWSMKIVRCKISHSRNQHKIIREKKQISRTIPIDKLYCLHLIKAYEMKWRNIDFNSKEILPNLVLAPYKMKRLEHLHRLALDLRSFLEILVHTIFRNIQQRAIANVWALEVTVCVCVCMAPWFAELCNSTEIIITRRRREKNKLKNMINNDCYNRNLLLKNCVLYWKMMPIKACN